MKLAELRAVPQDEPAPPSRWPRWLVGAVVLILLACVAVGIVLMTTPPDRRPVPPTAVPAAPPSAAAPTAPVPAPVDLTIPTTTPPGLSWSVFAGEWEPSHPTAGPKQVAGAVASGYERSPLGALIAAQQIGTRLLMAPRDGWHDVALRQVVPGPTRSQYVTGRAKTTDDPPAGGWAQPIGFRYVTWTPDAAQLQLLVKPADSTGYQGVNESLVWRDGDWRLQLDTPSGPAPAPFQVPTSTGFVLWGAPNA